MQSTTTIILFATLATIVLSAKLMKPGDSENESKFLRVLMTENLFLISVEIVGPCVNLKVREQIYPTPIVFFLVFVDFYPQKKFARVELYSAFDRN